MVVDALGTFLEVGPSATNVFGHPPEELHGRSCFEFVHPDDVLLAVDGLTNSLASSGRPTEHLRIRVAGADGSWHPVDALVNNLLADPEVAGIVLTVRDRAGDEELERSLREREDRYRQVAELALEGVWYLDQGNRTTFVTQRLATMLGVSVGDMVGRPVLDFVHQGDRFQAEEFLTRRHRGVHDEQTLRLCHRAGRSVWVRMSATPVHSPAGLYAGAIALVSDVTEQRVAEQRLAATEAREQAILHALPDVLFRISPDGTVVEHRSGRDDSLSALASRLTGRHLREVVPPEVADQALEAVRRAVASGQVVSFTYELEFDGALRNYEARMSSVAGGEVVALVRDVTEIHQAERSRQEYLLEVQRREAAEELAEMERGMARAARLEALGRLAGGVAHDMNNLLGVIANYSAAIRRSTAEVDTAQDVVEIERVVRRGTQLTKRLLLFGRQDSTTVEVQDLVRIVTGVGAMLDRTIGPLHQLRTEVGDDPVWVSADRWQLEQAIINLVLNARDASPPGTRIVVSVVDGEDNAVLSVSDEGSGMSAEVQERAFEPFFTTKEPGSGTGLGLAVVHGVAVEAGGSVQIDSDVGTGTTVTLTVPRHADPPDQHEPTRAEPVAVVPMVAGTLLVVDDHEDTRRSMTRLLEGEGYEVHVASSGEQALTLLAGTQRVDAVVSDVAMPNMTGPALVRRLRLERPGLPVVLLTGYGSDLVGDVPDDVPVLGKPLILDDLVRVLSGLLSPV